MNILVIDSSPKARGNSVRLGDAFVQALAKEHRVTRINVAQKKIGPCHACNYCRSHRSACAQRDDMGALYQAIRRAQVLVLTSPVYYWGVSAQLKLFIDRWYALNNRPLKGKKLVILVCGQDVPLGIQHDLIRGQFRAISEYAGMEFVGYVGATAEDLEKRPVEKDAAALAAAAALARDL